MLRRMAAARAVSSRSAWMTAITPDRAGRSLHRCAVGKTTTLPEQQLGVWAADQSANFELADSDATPA